MSEREVCYPSATRLGISLYTRHNLYAMVWALLGLLGVVFLLNSTFFAGFTEAFGNFFLFFKKVVYSLLFFLVLPRFLKGLWIWRFISPSIDFKGVKIEDDGFLLLGLNKKIRWEDVIKIETFKRDFLFLVWLRRGEAIPLGFIVIFRSLPNYGEFLSLLRERCRENREEPVGDGKIGAVYEYPDRLWCTLAIVSTILFAYFNYSFFFAILLPDLSKILQEITRDWLIPYAKTGGDFASAFLLSLPYIVLVYLTIFSLSPLILYAKYILPILLPRKIEMRREIAGIVRDVIFFKAKNWHIKGDIVLLSNLGVPVFGGISRLLLRKEG